MNDKRLLIMDDEPDFADYMREVGESMDYDVRVQTNTALFRSAYSSFNPTVIILDIVMPQEDGIELIQWLATEDTKAKIIVVTGHNPDFARFAEVIANAKGLAQVQTFSKPIKPADLRRALEETDVED